MHSLMKGWKIQLKLMKAVTRHQSDTQQKSKALCSIFTVLKRNSDLFLN